MLTSQAAALVCLFAAGSTVVTYRGIALERGWPVGTSFMRERWYIIVPGYASVIASIVVAFISTGVGGILTLLLWGFGLSGLVLGLLRRWAQPLAALGMPAAWLWVLIAYT